MAKAKKVKKQPEPFWNEQVRIFFDFTKNKFHESPSFDGSSPRNLKNILTELRKRAEEKGVEWTYEVATTRFRLFLEHAFMDRWLSENWLLQNIDRQKDKLFFSITRQYLSR
jgi:hypothetical protein